MHILLTLAYGLLFLAIIQRWRFFADSGLPVRFIQGVFLLKIAFGLGLWWIYTYHYSYRDTSDAFRYFDNAMVIFSSLGENPMHYIRLMTGVGLDHPDLACYFEAMNGWSKSYNYGILNDNPTIIRINALIALFSQGAYHVHTVFMCFFSLTGLTALYRAFSLECTERRWAFAIAVFLIPSMLFWASGVLKEAPLTLFMGLFVLAVLRLKKDWKDMRWWFLLVAAFAGMLFLKMYVLVALMPSVLIAKAAALTGTRRLGLKAAVMIGFSALLALNAGYFFRGGDLLYVLDRKQTDFYNVAEMQQAGSVIEIPEVSDVPTFVLNAPVSLYNTYFRPDLTEVDGAFYFALACENTVILALLVLAIVFWKWDRKGAFLRWFCLCFVVVYGLIVGSTVPILGAIVRYKIPALPFLLVALLSGGLGLKIETWMNQRLYGRK